MDKNIYFKIEGNTILEKYFDILKKKKKKKKRNTRHEVSC